MQMDLKELMELYIQALKKDMEDKLFKQWLVDYNRMTSETFISFADYKSKIFKTENKEKLDVKQIIKDAEEIKRLDQRGGNI